MEPVKGFYGDAEVGEIQNLPEGTKAVVVRKLAEGMATAVVMHKNTIKRHLLIESDGQSKLGPVDVEFELRGPWIETYPDQIGRITQACWSAAMALPTHSVVHRWGPDMPWGGNRGDRVSPLTAVLEPDPSESSSSTARVKMIIAVWIIAVLLAGAGTGCVRAGNYGAALVAYCLAAGLAGALMVATFQLKED